MRIIGGLEPVLVSLMRVSWSLRRIMYLDGVVGACCLEPGADAAHGIYGFGGADER